MHPDQRFGFAFGPRPIGFRPRPFGIYGRRPFYGSPFVGGLLGGLVGSTILNPYFYTGYPYATPFYPPVYGGGFYW
ncbi:hypothetical protein [Litchfieldia salsa]|uniref:Uncharacterized protein n=1 Tax=Litchfieldia salsa TaxID=930152 RepID=A0A1H0VCZ6_9BACI|nr:hypothetical protein [Litchfieldia salsa]SDP76449.1 hypothetical protein SAMN05216565_106206 [Litchfieldia salsa]